MLMTPLLAAYLSPLRKCWTSSMSSPPASQKTWCAATSTDIEEDTSAKTTALRALSTELCCAVHVCRDGRRGFVRLTAIMSVDGLSPASVF
jgi:hypothetical protein